MNSRVRMNSAEHILIETPPGYRTIFVTSGNKARKIRLLFPWVYHNIIYSLNDINKFINPEVAVFFKRERLSSLEEVFYKSPTEFDMGAICFPEHQILMEYNSVKDMSKELVATWWGLIHFVDEFELNKWINLGGCLSGSTDTIRGEKYFSRAYIKSTTLIDEEL